MSPMLFYETIFSQTDLGNAILEYAKIELESSEFGRTSTAIVFWLDLIGYGICEHDRVPPDNS